jgi:DNA polymerase I-like protein with 3'-5' exonuclease and polymerase domains
MKPPIAYDIETTGLGTVRGEGSIHCYSLTNDEISVTYEWDEKGIDFLRGIIEEYRLVCHSAQFDIASTNAFTGWGLTHEDYACTQVLAHAINPQLPSYSLDSLTGEKMDYMQAMIDAGLFTRTTTTKTPSKEEKARLFALPFSPVMEAYNLQDTKATWDLWCSQQVHLERDPRLADAYWGIQNPFVDVVMSMHNGMHIDIQAMYTLLSDVRSQVGEDYEEFLREYPLIPKIKWDKEKKMWVPTGDLVPPSLSSPNDVTSLLYMHGWEPTEFNRDTGRPLTDKATLNVLVAKESTPTPLKKIAKRMLEMRSTVGVGTQLTSMLTIVTETNSPIIHANWHQTGTVTGRMSSSSPNCQNLSVRHPLWGKRTRASFTPPPGFSLLVGDLSQVELAVLAYYLELFMGDSGMAQAVRDEVDVHDRNTQAWKGVSRGEEGFKTQRSICKNGVFASSYGAKAKRLALTLCISVSDAQEILTTFENNVPIEKLKEFVYAVVASERDVEPVLFQWRKCTSGFMYDGMGVRHFYPDINSNDRYKRTRTERQVFNSLMQSTVASLFMSLCSKVNPYLVSKGGWISATVHDECLVIVPTEFAEEALAVCNEAFNSHTFPTEQGGVPIRSSFDICTNWSEKS